MVERKVPNSLEGHDRRIMAGKALREGEIVVLKMPNTPDDGVEAIVERVVRDANGVPVTINVFYMKDGIKHTIQGLPSNKWQAKL